jgi:hypothetical protein
MAELDRRSPDNPDFARVLDLRAVRNLDEVPFDIAPTEAEAEALARLMGAREVRKLRLEGTLRREPAGGWRLEARLRASVVQTCVVTLEPLTTRIDQPVTRRYLPGAAAAPVVDPEEEDETEPLPDRLDLGLVATEALALALPPYPRKPGAALAPAAAEGGEVRPFAALEALRGKLGEGS